MNGELTSPGEWMRAVRTMRFGTIDGVRGPMIRCVAMTFASFADYRNGTRAHPGVALLAICSEVDYRTARTVVGILRRLGLIELVKGGRRKGSADEYRLSMPDDITDRVRVLSPAEIDLEVERIREANRSRPQKPRVSADPVRGAGPDAVREAPTPVHDVETRVSPDPVQTGVQVSPTPVAECTPENRTGVADTANPVCTGETHGPYGCRCAPPPKHPHRDTSTTETPRSDLGSDVTVPGARGLAEEDQFSAVVEGDEPDSPGAVAKASIRAILSNRRPREETQPCRESSPRSGEAGTATPRTARTGSAARPAARSVPGSGKGRGSSQRSLWPSPVPEPASPAAPSASPRSTVESTSAATDDQHQVEVA